MKIPDLINAIFESSGGFILLLDVFKMIKDKQLKGVHWGPRIFFMSWGYWNLYYYPHLDQWLSFIGGVFLVAVNTLWVVLACIYLRGNK